jgi:two-component system, cell cycle response regulator DivK
MKLLVVEDDPWSQHLVREVLEMGGHEVTVADNITDARARLDGVHAILLDIHLPGGGGELLLRELRASEAHAKLPVIALTASAMTGDRERFLRVGFSGYMSKPIDVRTFCKTVEELVQ